MRADNTQIDSLICEIDRINFSEASKAYQLIEKLTKIADDNPANHSAKIQALYWKTAIDYLQGQYDTLVVAEIRNILQKVTEKQHFETALLQHALAMNYTTASRYADAFKYGLIALDAFEKLNKPIFIAKAAISLGNICTYIKSYKMAENYYNHAKKYVNSEQFEYYQILLNQSKLFFYTQPIEIAIDSMLAIIPAIENYHNIGLRSIANLNLATYYIMQGNFEKAYQYYDSALKFIETMDNNKLKFTLYQGLGIYYFSIADFSKAFKYFYASKQIALQDGNEERLSYALYNLGFIFEEIGRIDSSLYYLKKYNEVNNRLLSNSGAIEAYQAYVSFFLETSENKLTIAEQEIKLKNRRLIVVAIAAIAIIALGILLFIIFQQKKRQQALLKEAEKKDLEARLEHEQKVKQLQTKRHKEGLDAKVREITSYSLLLSNKNQVLQQIATIVKRLPSEQPEAIEINGIIKSNINTDQAWDNFMLHFQKVHPRFFQQLKTFPFAKKLTENELRLCAYLRIGMISKQIAQVLNISPESVRIQRYRLKKKFGLGAEDDLDDFLRNM